MPLKIALIGAGHMGRIHLGKLLGFEDVEVIGVTDIDKSMLNGISENHNLPVFQDYRDIAEGLTGAVIASSTDSHYEIAKHFLEKGVHVFIEKPITKEITQGEALVEIAEKRGLILQIGLLERFNPAMKKAASHVNRPLFIDARRMSSFTGRSTDIDVVLDLMIHDIDLVLSIVNDDVGAINAYGMPFVSEKLDMATAWIEFRGGCVACIAASRVSVNKERTITIFENDRRYFVDLLNGRLTGTIKKHDGDIDTVDYEADKVDSVKEELLEFISSIRGEKKPRVGGREGLKALIVAEQIKEYIATNKS